MTEVASAQTLIIPSLSVSETYDSNVFFTPKALLSPGSKPEDYITIVTPQINVAHAGQFVTGSLSVGALIMRYLNNPDLDFTGYNAASLLDLKGLANKVSQRLTTLSLIGTYRFTPAQSGFGPVAAGSGVGTSFGSTQFGPLNAGLITNRVSTHVYTLGVTGGYLLTPLTTLTATYNYTRLSFGSQSGGVDNALFDTTGHQGSAALSTRLTPTDTVGATASMATYSQDQSTGGGTSSFTTAYGTVNWARLWTQQWSSSLAGGGIVTLPQESATSGQSVKSTIAPTATAVINYTSFSEALRAAGSTLGPSDNLPSYQGPFANLPTLGGSLSPGGIMSPGQYTASLVYTFSVFPSYVGGAGAIRTHVIGINLAGGITSKLSGQAGMNYAHSGGSGTVGTYDTVGLTAGLRYLIGPILASLTANYLNFSSSTPSSSVSGVTASSVTAFSKEMVMLTLSTAFNSQSFFRMGGFGTWGTESFREGTSAPSGVEPGGGGAQPGGGSSGAEPRK